MGQMNPNKGKGREERGKEESAGKENYRTEGGGRIEMGGEEREEKEKKKTEEQWSWEMMKERKKTYFN